MKKLAVYTVLVAMLMIIWGCKNSTSAELTDLADDLTKNKMESVLEFISSDHFEGRSPGTKGGYLAEDYVKSLFKLLGFSPGYKTGFLQPFKLKGFTTTDLKIILGNTRLDHRTDLVGTYTRPEKDFNFQADVVFVGFGITAPAWNWHDYQGADVKDKIVVTRINDPGMFLKDIFEGKVLTYFGRWIYHVEEAARRGAAGILMIHTDDSAGYSWKTVNNSWAGEEVYLESDLENRLKFRGWIKESSLARVLADFKIDLKELYAASLKNDFKLQDLGIKLNISGSNQFREIINHNIVARIPGKSKKRIVLSAHIDHLGKIDKSGDNILNGAVDNGSAVTAMILTAEILKACQHELKYTIELLACNAEEGGMLGSRYFVQNSDRENILANINFESTPVWEKSTSIMGIGARFSTLEDAIRQIASDQGLNYSYFSLANQGLFYRSDQFSFARYGIPAVWISAGEEEVDGNRNFTRFWSTVYHTVKDEFDPGWKLAGLKQTIHSALLLINQLNQAKTVPQWKTNLTFPFEQ